MAPKHLIELKKDPFLENRHVLTPNQESQKQPISHVSLVVHMYNTSIRVDPRGLHL